MNILHEDQFHIFLLVGEESTRLYFFQNNNNTSHQKDEFQYFMTSLTRCNIANFSAITHIHGWESY